MCLGARAYACACAGVCVGVCVEGCWPISLIFGEKKSGKRKNKSIETESIPRAALVAAHGADLMKNWGPDARRIYSGIHNSRRS